MAEALAAIPILSVLVPALKGYFELYQNLKNDNFIIKRIGKVDWNTDLLNVEWYIKRSANKSRWINEKIHIESAKNATYQVFPTSRELKEFIRFIDNELIVDISVINKIKNMKHLF